MYSIYSVGFAYIFLSAVQFVDQLKIWWWWRWWWRRRRWQWWMGGGV